MIVDIVFGLFLLYLIVGNCVRFIMWIKCFRVKECSSSQCFYRNMCGKYCPEITDEEMEDLSRFIEELKRKSIAEKQKRNV